MRQEGNSIYFDTQEQLSKAMAILGKHKMYPTVINLGKEHYLRFGIVEKTDEAKRILDAEGKGQL